MCLVASGLVDVGLPDRLKEGVRECVHGVCSPIQVCRSVLVPRARAHSVRPFVPEPVLTAHWATPANSGHGQILGNCESIEPYTSNIFARRVLSGEFQVVNKHLLKVSRRPSVSGAL